MEAGAEAAITFSPHEAEIVRAALFTIEHYASNVWDQDEVRAVSGFAVGEFASLRRRLDAVRCD
jgi:hypothetical protein